MMDAKKKLRVAVVFGGRSGEHQISLQSAASVMRALSPDRYELVPVGISREGRWLRGDDPLRVLQGDSTESLHPTQLLTDPDARGLARLDAAFGPTASREAIDVVFPVLHGPYGEDGTIQGLLELAGIPYVGCGVAASAVGMDKALMKGLFAASRLPQVPYTTFLRQDWDAAPDAVQARLAEALHLPIFVKPCNLGSSVGVHKVTRWEELGPAVADASAYDRKVLVEQGVDAREIEVAVLGNDHPEASVPGEVEPGADFYDYRAKYVDDGSRLLIPAPLAPEIADRIRELAVEAFRAIDGAGMARVDFFLARDSSEIWVNEVNTIPGFTKISMYPKLWEASGLPYDKLLDRLVELALERHADRQRSRTSYKPA